ncbi:MAG: extracellular solute-binding protein [Christensenellales bacterium]|jgi:putative aldouronate transport system substrate-binding protein
MKKVFPLLLALCILLMSMAFAEEMDLTDINGNTVQDYRDFSQYPLSDGSESLRIAVIRSDTYGIDAKDIWFWNWIEKVSGVKMEVEQVLDSALNDRKVLMLASGDLPDLILGFNFSTSDLVTYGMGEGLFANIKDQITNPEIMPNLASCLEHDPSIMAAITCLDGNVYSLPGMRAAMIGESDRIFIDSDLLAAVGKELPTTLDDFIDTMYAFKEHNPDLIPLGGADTAYNPTYYILNAMGYLGNSGNDGTRVTIRNGEAVIPACDETFVEVLKVMNQFYKDGIISQDFYSIDGTTVNAQMAEGKLGVYPFVPFVVNADPAFYEHWESVTPLTSQWNDTQQWKSIDLTRVGGAVISAESEKIELALRLMDFLYSPLGNNLSWLGPIAGTDYTMGMSGGWYLDPETKSEHFVDVENGLYANSSEYVQKVGLGVYESASNNGAWPETPGYTMYQLRQWISGMEVVEDKFDTTQPDPYFRNSMKTAITPYECAGYPGIVYMLEDDVYARADLESVLVPYMRAEIAKFITGARDLSEYDAYLEEIKGMGSEEYQQYYKTNYDNYLTAQN